MYVIIAFIFVRKNIDIYRRGDVYDRGSFLSVYACAA